MYFVKHINFKIDRKDEESSVNHKIDFSDFYRPFGFIKSIYKDKKELFRELQTKHPRLIADIAASVMKHIFEDGFIKKDKLKDTIVCIQAIIADLGYEELTDSGVSEYLNVSPAKTNNVMLVAGCQNRKMLDARVDLAVEIATTYSKNMHVVASGAKPNPEKPAKIDNEATRMVNLFTLGVKQIIEDQSKRPRIDVLPEKKAENTKGNIARFFDGNFFNRELENQIIIVSSTSHLIRLAQDIENFIQNNSEAIPFRISNIVLCGSEGLDKLFYIDNDHLFKHIMLEIYDYLLIKMFEDESYLQED
jgi:hypothetical protein